MAKSSLAILILVTMVVSTLVVVWPDSSLATAGSSTVPLLYPEDTWKFDYGNFTSVLTVLYVYPCGGDLCTVDRESSRTQLYFQARDSHWALVRDNVTGIGYTRNETFTPVAPLYSWPLAVGNSWTISSNVTSTYLDNAGDVRTNSSIWQQTRRVASETSVTVPAGTFDTFLIEGFENSRLVLRRWFSYQTKTSVRAEFYNATGAITSSFRLVSCNLTGFTCSSSTSGTGLSSSTYELIGGASASGILVVGAILLLRSRSKKIANLARSGQRKNLRARVSCDLNSLGYTKFQQLDGSS